MRTIHPPALPRAAAAVGASVLLLACASLAFAPVLAQAAVTSTTAPNAQQAASTEKVGASLESAATKAGNTARTVAMSLIGLALAVASIVLAFRRDFKEAAGVFAVGIVAVLLATPAGLSLLRSTVTSLFG
ncbi:MAG TPA: hypothetical protein VGX26_03985 [Solirubrobacteraceae bacterium]|jgi:hypothetical protein|nr:hypothetical protein [Solirubrobacteraceae bacterium]